MEQDTLDATWLHAIADVRLGAFSSRKRFRESIMTKGVRTERQRWWLAKLVAMHRKQIRSDFAVASAQAFLDTHPEQDLRAAHKPAKAVKAVPVPMPDPPRNLDLLGRGRNFVTPWISCEHRTLMRPIHLSDIWPISDSSPAPVMTARAIPLIAG